MYKKVTHTIVEEHFGSQDAAEIKQILDANYGDGYVEMRSMIGTTTADKFKSDIRAYFDTMHLRFTNIANATENGNMDSLLTEETAFFDEADDLGKLLLPYYGIEFSERLSQVFRGLGLSMIGIGRNLKFKTDIKFILERLDPNFDQLDFLMNQYNNAWAPGSVKPAWMSIKDSLIAETAAIMNKDNTASVAAHALVTDKLTAFANSLSNAVIQQYPTKFIQ